VIFIFIKEAVAPESFLKLSLIRRL